MRPVVLIICDGWGVAPSSPGNAITLARTPVFDRWLHEYPSTELEASGESVGLTAGMMGNSEVGHLNLGAGRVVPQDLLRVDLSLRDGSFYQNPVLLSSIAKARDSGKPLHLMGLLSDGGVHSHERHLFGLLELARRHGISNVKVHVFTDGRDTPPRSALDYVARLEQKLREIGGEIVTVAGRYFAMDRDSHWERTARAYDAIVHGKGLRSESARAAVEAAYSRDEGDEFIQPTVLRPEGMLTDGHPAIFFNFRADRARQLARALSDPDFREFDRGLFTPASPLVCFTEYKKEFALPVAFPTLALTHILAEVWAEHGVRNLRVAETEKYAHVTYFFNGGVEKAFPGEERILVPSWRGATHDLHPQMKATQITEEVEKALAGGEFGALVVNFANADMVGHTGKLPETIQAIEVLDACFVRVEKAVREREGLFIMTGDHGNAEQMFDPATQGPHTAHTTNPVPFVLGGHPPVKLAAGGALADVATTILALQRLPVPREMTGQDLRRPQ
jgi:2,3-bisphosphoglycerate-independent phosphoglycerate mutase